MNIVNNSLHTSVLVNKPSPNAALEKSSTGNAQSTKQVAQATAVSANSPSGTFSMVLSETQKETLGYDQPNPQQRGAVQAYQRIATQQQRDEIIDSMSFHFVV